MNGFVFYSLPIATHKPKQIGTYVICIQAHSISFSSIASPSPMRTLRLHHHLSSQMAGTLHRLKAPMANTHLPSSLSSRKALMLMWMTFQFLLR